MSKREPSFVRVVLGMIVGTAAGVVMLVVLGDDWGEAVRLGVLLLIIIGFFGAWDYYKAKAPQLSVRSGVMFVLSAAIAYLVYNLAFGDSVVRAALATALLTGIAALYVAWDYRGAARGRREDVGPATT